MTITPQKREYNRRYGQLHRARLNISKAAWQKANPDRHKASKRRWWANLSDADKEAQRARDREACRKSAEKHRAKIEEYRVRYRQLTKEQRRIRDAEKHKQVMADPIKRKAMQARSRRSYAKNGRGRMYAAKRRALKRAATVNLKGLQDFVASVKSKPFTRCYYCDAPVSTTAIHFDHIVALSKGGSHTADNLCVACGPCNCSKHNKPLAVWIKTRDGQQLLNL